MLTERTVALERKVGQKCQSLIVANSLNPAII